jgi:hypothetical protein
MKMRRLDIYWNEYTAPGGRYEGTVSFQGGLGEVKLNLRPDLSDKILAAVQAEIVVSAREVAQELSVQALRPLQLEEKD